MERDAKFKIGEIVKHKFLSFRGVIFDVDPTFNNTDEWWLSIPEEIRPRKDQPFYHLLAENDVTEYVAYVSEQNLLYDINKDPVRHPQVDELFSEYKDGSYLISQERMHYLFCKKTIVPFLFVYLLKTFISFGQNIF